MNTMHTNLQLLLIAIVSCTAATLIITQVFSIPLRSSHLQEHVGSPAHPARAAAPPAVPSSVSAQVLKLAQLHAAKAEQRAARLQHGAAVSETELLTQAFQRCDKDGSSWVSLSEAELCIRHQVTLHLTQALRENFFIFTALDRNPANGAVSWSEHMTYYLSKRGYDQHFIDSHLHSMKGLKREEKEGIMRDKAAWSEAARGDPDVLSLDEFLAFKHPESSHATILGKVEELLAAKDGDSDSQITLEEYMAAAEEQEQEQADQKQFKETDADGNGKLSRKELLLYMDPRHPHHARVEAESLMAAADSDTDGKLTLAELLQQSSIFAASKMVDAASSFHNEF